MSTDTDYEHEEIEERSYSDRLLDLFKRYWREKIPRPGHKRYSGRNRLQRRAKYSVKRMDYGKHIRVENRRTHPLTGEPFMEMDLASRRVVNVKKECILHATKGWRIRAIH